MTHHPTDTMKHARARTNHPAGLSQTLLFLILKRLETTRPDDNQQQGHQ